MSDKAGAREVFVLGTGEEVRDRVTIDGEAYTFTSTRSWGLAQRSRVRRLLERITSLEEIEAVTPEAEAEYSAALGEIVSVVLPDLPSEVRAKLGTGQLSDVAAAFIASTARHSGRLELLASVQAKR